MAIEAELAGRIRAALSFQAGVTERRMFGGCAFLPDGHLARRSERTRRLDAQVTRVSPARSSTATASAHS